MNKYCYLSICYKIGDKKELEKKAKLAGFFIKRNGKKVVNISGYIKSKSLE